MRLILHYMRNIFLCFIVPFLLGNLAYISMRRRVPGKESVLRLCFFAYMLSVCSQTILPRVDYGILSSGEPYIEFLFSSGNESNLNLLPLRTIWTYLTGNVADIEDSDQASVAISNLLGNIGMCIPIGFLLPIISDKCHHLSRVSLYSVIGSISVEVVQFFIGRSTDIDDVLLRLLGTWIGYLLWQQITAYERNKKPPKARQGEAYGKEV